MTQRADTSMKPHAIYVRSTLRSLIVRVNGRPQVHNRESITPVQELTLPKQFETVADFLREYELPTDLPIDCTDPDAIKVTVTYLLSADTGIGPGFDVTVVNPAPNAAP